MPNKLYPKEITISNLNRLLVVFVILVAQLSACGSQPASNQPSAELMQTQVALGVMATSLAFQQETLTAANSQIPATSTLEPATATPEPATVAPPTETSTPAPSPTVDVKSRIANANILIYEDIAGYPALSRYIYKALGKMAFRGKVEQVADATGNFMKRLNSSIKWDLIISASEVRTAISGEFWDLLTEQVTEKNAALIAEVWYIDTLGKGKMAPFLKDCGVTLHKNWVRPSDFDPADYSIFWLEPDNPVFNYPNQVLPLIASTNYWPDDAGDLLQLTDGSNAVILASHHENQNSMWGLITSCFDGRVLLQTFSTHDYPEKDMVALWQNYIYYTLTNHFRTMP